MRTPGAARADVDELLDELAAAAAELELDVLEATLLDDELLDETTLELVEELLELKEEEEDEAALLPDPPPPQASKALVSKTRLRDFPVRARGILNSP